jgi:hypothetical protein
MSRDQLIILAVTATGCAIFVTLTWWFKRQETRAASR